MLPLLSSDAVTVEPGFDCYAIVWGVARWGRNAKVLEALDVRDIASRHICMGESLASCFVEDTNQDCMRNRGWEQGVRQLEEESRSFTGL
jgi:hypothetical protein